jgi:hypothetical protein
MVGMGGLGAAAAAVSATGAAASTTTTLDWIVVTDPAYGADRNDGGTGAQSPQFGISVSGATYVAVDGGFSWGQSVGWNDGGGNAVLRRGPNVGEASGPQTGQVLSLTNDWGTDSGSKLSIGLNAADQTGLAVTASSTNINQPLVLLTAGSSSADALIKARVAGDTASRLILSAAGQLSLGDGATGADASWGRLGVAQIGTTDSDPSSRAWPARD